MYCKWSILFTKGPISYSSARKTTFPYTRPEIVFKKWIALEEANYSKMIHEVIEMKNNNIEIRIGPEVNLESVNKIQTNSSVICIQCSKKVNSKF